MRISGTLAAHFSFIGSTSDRAFHLTWSVLFLWARRFPVCMWKFRVKWQLCMVHFAFWGLFKILTSLNYRCVITGGHISAWTSSIFYLQTRVKIGWNYFLSDNKIIIKHNQFWVIFTHKSNTKRSSGIRTQKRHMYKHYYWQIFKWLYFCMHVYKEPSPGLMVSYSL